MANILRTALLILDYQVGVGDQEYAQAAASNAAQALAAARRACIATVFSKIDFLPNFADVSPNNRVFNTIKERKLIPPGSSRVIPTLNPAEGELVLNKDRYSAFAANALHEVLRAQEVEHLVLCGLDTSGVVLATYVEAVDLDYKVTVLSDACADKDGALHTMLISALFPHSADVLTASAWAASLVS